MGTINSYLAIDKNVGKYGRAASVLTGSVLILCAYSGKRPVISALAGSYLFFRGITGYCPMNDILATDFSNAIEIRHALTVNRPRDEVYRFWRELGNLPLFMKHLKSVTQTAEKSSEWVAAIPSKLGTVKWEAEITADIENEIIAWRSLEHSSVETMGHVAFKDAGKFGTEVHVVLHYKAPAGRIGEGIAKLFNPVFSEMVKEDIKNFRRYIETGEIPTTDGQPGRV